MTTIESGVTTGLEAARVIVERRGGRPVQIAEPDAGIGALYFLHRTTPLGKSLKGSLPPGWMHAGCSGAHRAREAALADQAPFRSQLPRDRLRLFDEQGD
jgi:hypothetical protein